MRHLRTLALCVLGASALAGFVATSASAALPEWGQCRATASGSGGKYANAGCTQQVKRVYGSYPGGYEWFPLGRGPEEIEEEEQSALLWEQNDTSFEAPVKHATFKFAGHEIGCVAGLEPGATLPLDGAKAVTDAPRFELWNCVEPVRAAENHGHLGAGGSMPGSCRSFEGREGAIATFQANDNGLSTPPSGLTWFGNTAFLSGKTSPTPTAGVVYKTEPAKERFYEQIVCESGEDSQPLSIQVGGHKRSERMVAQVEPVNSMSSAYEGTLRSQGVEALVNTGEWEPMAIEVPLYFPGPLHIGYEQRLAGEEAYGEQNYRYHDVLELKATP